MSMVFKFMQAEWNVFLRHSREVVKLNASGAGLCSSCCLFKLWMLTGRQVAVWRKQACCWLISSPASDEPKRPHRGSNKGSPGILAWFTSEMCKLISRPSGQPPAVNSLLSFAVQAVPTRAAEPNLNCCWWLPCGYPVCMCWSKKFMLWPLCLSKLQNIQIRRCWSKCAKKKELQLFWLNPLVAVVAVTPALLSLRGETMRESTAVCGI